MVQEMSHESKLKTEASQSGVYKIRLKGHLDDQWTDWFTGLTITLEENGITVLTGPVVDQAALFGLLKKVRDLGMPLISIQCADTGKEDKLDEHPENTY